tara:strand:+ start:229 stop:636 length:408 start_codon:yes stop_codon:yes gene_type:complete
MKKPQSPSLISLESRSSTTGTLTIMEGTNDIPFAIARIFYISESEPSLRGEHAHLLCNQALVCLSGEIEVICWDGFNETSWILSESNKCLHIPPMIWSSQKYKKKDSLLLVACDRPYEEEDYVRELKKYQDMIMP